MSIATDEEAERILKWHKPFGVDEDEPADYFGECFVCRTDWPCDTMIVLMLEMGWLV